MTAGIKRMLAERAKREEGLLNTPKRLTEDDAAMKMIDLAQPFIDGLHPDPTKFAPSALLRIGYCVIGTSKSPESALDFVERHLNEARKRYKAGLNPNPFIKD